MWVNGVSVSKATIMPKCLNQSVGQPTAPSWRLGWLLDVVVILTKFISFGSYLYSLTSAHERTCLETVDLRYL